MREAFRGTGYTAQIMPTATKAPAASTPAFRLNHVVQVPTAQDLLVPVTRQIFGMIEQMQRLLLDLDREMSHGLLEATRPVRDQPVDSATAPPRC